MRRTHRIIGELVALIVSLYMGGYLIHIVPSGCWYEVQTVGIIFAGWLLWAARIALLVYQEIDERRTKIAG